jgi:predicted RNA-binding Zn-ribbon protein involved in translation (DUF1610 family)
MNWNNLKIISCPSCEGDLSLSDDKKIFSCPGCGKFLITVEKCKKIVDSMYITKRDFYGQAEFEELLEATLKE